MEETLVVLAEGGLWRLGIVQVRCGGRGGGVQK